MCSKLRIFQVYNVMSLDVRTVEKLYQVHGNERIHHSGSAPRLCDCTSPGHRCLSCCDYRVSCIF